MHPQVSVVIPALNVADTLGLQLSALSHQEFAGSYEIIVADNGSTDDTAAMARAAGVRVVDASSRQGINHARNVGAHHARGEFVLFCDGDDVVCAGWIERMVAGLASAEAVGGTVMHFRSEELVGGKDFREDHSRLAEGRVSEMPLGAGHRFLTYPMGANCGVRRSYWEALGGFNEEYDAGGSDEVEFFWRLQLAGGKLEFVDAPVLYRLRSDTRARLRKRYRTAREAIRIYRDLRQAGLSRRSTPAALKSYGWLLAKLPKALVSPAIREHWWDVGARQAGRIAGCIRYRVYAP